MLSISSKIIRIALFSIASVVVFSCNKDINKEIIPDVPVYIGPIHITDPEYQELFNLTYGTHVELDQGYMGNGIVVVNMGNNEFAAYDCTCTHEIESGCFVRPDESNSIIVKCKCCGSTYELLNGSVTQGPANYPLKKYKVTFNGEYLSIYNQ